MLNTLPSNAVPAGAAAAGSIPVPGGVLSQFYPKLVRTALGNATFDNQNTSNYFEGFVGDGDYVVLPTTALGNLEYFNNAGVSQWTVAPTDILAAADTWVGFFYDETDDLIYCMVADNGTTNDTYGLGSVNAAGTVVAIGNAAPTVAMPTENGSKWTIAGTDGATTIQRVEDGSGNILVFMRENTGFYEMEVSIVDGSIVSEPTQVGDLSYSNMAFKTSDGHYIVQDGSSAINFIYNGSLFAGISIDLDVQDHIGWSFATNLRFIQWKGKIVSTLSDSVTGPLASRLLVSTGLFNNWVHNVGVTIGSINGVLK